jgi:two-component system nitrate/nitrite response regulator NarL
MISVAVVDDDQMLLDGITLWLRSVDGLRLTATARTIDEFLCQLAAPADVVVLDLFLADASDPVGNIRRLLAAGSRVLAVGACAGASAELGQQVLRAGASGYLTKEDALEALVAAVREVASDGGLHSAGPLRAGSRLRAGGLADAGRRPADAGGRPRLSPQERAILIAYASGMTLATAARRVGVQPVTAKNYLARVKEKYRQAGRPTFTKLDLAARVREDGLSDSAALFPNPARPHAY